MHRQCLAFSTCLLALAIALPIPAGAAPRIGPATAVDPPATTPLWQGEREPALAFGGQHYLAVWSDAHDGNAIRGARLDRLGRAVEPGGFRIAGGYSQDWDVGFGGGVFLVVWQTEAGVFGARVDAAGAVLDGTPLP